MNVLSTRVARQTQKGFVCVEFTLPEMRGSLMDRGGFKRRFDATMYVRPDGVFAERCGRRDYHASLSDQAGSGAVAAKRHQDTSVLNGSCRCIPANDYDLWHRTVCGIAKQRDCILSGRTDGSRFSGASKGKTWLSRGIDLDVNARNKEIVGNKGSSN